MVQTFHTLRCGVMHEIAKEGNDFGRRVLQTAPLIWAVIHFKQPFIRSDHSGLSGKDTCRLHRPHQRAGKNAVEANRLLLEKVFDGLCLRDASFVQRIVSASLQPLFPILCRFTVTNQIDLLHHINSCFP